MSMNCDGCQHNTHINGISYCDYYKETKLNMDRKVGMKYLSFRAGTCPHDTRVEEPQDLIDRAALLEKIYGSNRPEINDGADEVNWIMECIETAEREERTR